MYWDWLFSLFPQQNYLAPKWKKRMFKTKLENIEKVFNYLKFNKFPDISGWIKLIICWSTKSRKYEEWWDGPTTIIRDLQVGEERRIKYVCKGTLNDNKIHFRRSSEGMKALDSWYSKNAGRHICFNSFSSDRRLDRPAIS